MKNKCLYLLLLLVLASACTKSSSDSNDNGDNGNGGSDREGEFRSDCGVVIGEELVNPVKAKDAENGTVDVQSANLVIFRNGEKTILVKLHSLSDVDDFRKDLAKKRLQELTRGTMLYYQTGEECTTSIGSRGTAFVGQLFTSQGVNVSEKLLSEGLADVEFGDDCFGELLSSCYDALQEDGPQFGGNVSDFLWKPVSERDGNLAILLNPGGAKVVVNGQTLPDFGPSNGRGTTVRANKSGCAFGKNVKVEAFDEDGRLLLWPGGAKSYTVADGCTRTEFM